jgi:hypothetical protein
MNAGTELENGWKSTKRTSDIAEQSTSNGARPGVAVDATASDMQAMRESLEDKIVHSCKPHLHNMFISDQIRRKFPKRVPKASEVYLAGRQLHNVP